MKLPNLRQLAVCVFLAFGASQLAAATKVTEGDYQKIIKLQYAEELCKARQMFARKDPERLEFAKSELAKTWKDSGWSKDQYSQAEDALNEVIANLRAEKSGDLSAEDVKSLLQESDPTTVATARAHFEEWENRRPSSQAEKAVRDEIDAERKGVPPTMAQIQGSWVFDCDATIDLLMGGLADDATRQKLKTDIQAKLGTPVYTFGPGNAAEVRSKGPDGADRVEKAVFRLDGNKIFFKGEQSKREQELQVGMRKGKLQMGLSFGMSVFTRQTP